MFIDRNRYLDELVARMHNGMIKVVTGPRRCGKSFLLFDIFVPHLLESGVDPAQVVSVSLDDDAFSELRDPGALSAFIAGRIAGGMPQYYVILDEVQYAISEAERRGDAAPRIYGVLNGLLRRRDVDVYVTGSNSRFLSTDVLTEFRGRGDEVRVHPLSFSEFMQAYPGAPARGWDEYVTYGGMPLVLAHEGEAAKARYLENLFAETYLKDVVAHNGIARTQELEDLVDILASSVGSLTNPPKIEATFKSRLRSRISANTISAYIRHLEEAFVVSEARRYDVKGRKYIGSPKKYYFEDVGLRNARLGFRQVEETHLMENVIYNELRYRGFSVDVGIVEERRKVDGRDVRSALEVDFVANLGSRRYYVQSALSTLDLAKAAQEARPLAGIPDSFKKIIVVRDDIAPRRDERGVTTLGLFDFLLKPDSLEL